MELCEIHAGFKAARKTKKCWLFDEEDQLLLIDSKLSELWWIISVYGNAKFVRFKQKHRRIKGVIKVASVRHFVLEI